MPLQSFRLFHRYFFSPKKQTKLSLNEKMSFVLFQPREDEKEEEGAEEGMCEQQRLWVRNI